MQITKRRIATIAVFAWAIFLLGGGLDLIKSFSGGLENASSMQYPIVTALSPVAMMLMGFGSLGLLLVYWSGKNRQNRKLSDRQFAVGFIMVWVIYALFEFTFRFGMKI